MKRMKLRINNDQDPRQFHTIGDVLEIAGPTVTSLSPGYIILKCLLKDPVLSNLEVNRKNKMLKHFQVIMPRPAECKYTFQAYVHKLKIIKDKEMSEIILRLASVVNIQEIHPKINLHKKL